MDVHYIILEAQKPGQLKYLTNKTLVGLNSRMQSLPSAVIKKEEVNPHAWTQLFKCQVTKTAEECNILKK